jgi:hypothetical protein
MKYGECRVQQISPYSSRPVCYTSEATKYGHTSYMIGNTITQIFQLYMCKSTKDSCLSMRLGNKVLIVGMIL